MSDLDELKRMLGDQSIPEELQDNWCEWVCQPIKDYPLAPRWARATLEVVGQLVGMKVPIEKILSEITDKYQRELTGRP